MPLPPIVDREGIKYYLNKIEQYSFLHYSIKSKLHYFELLFFVLLSGQMLY